MLTLVLAGCGSDVRFISTAASSSTAAPAAGACVTFIGDSITEAWPMDPFKASDGGCYLNHGKGGTTMPQILNGISNRSLPYDASVDPAVSNIAVVGGDVINSLNAGYTVTQIEGYYEQLIVTLQGLGVKPVLCTTLPTSNTKFNAETAKLNAWLRMRAASGGIPLVDIYDTVLVQADGSSNPAYFIPDRVHLLHSSYALLTGLVTAALKQARG